MNFLEHITKETLMHYGVPGMKWRKGRKSDDESEEETKIRPPVGVSKQNIGVEKNYSYKVRIGRKHSSSTRLTFDRKKFINRFKKGAKT